MIRSHRSGLVTWGLALAVAAAALLCSSCSRPTIDFPYPGEKMSFPGMGGGLPTVTIGSILDLRPDEQRLGDGHYSGITYPADRYWRMPVDDLYRAALTRDIQQTRLAELVPLASQADYILEAEIHSFHCRLERNSFSFLLPPALGMTVGMVWGDDGSSKLKRGLFASFIGLALMPLPAANSGECEVTLSLRDRTGEVVWQQTCIGEIDGTVYVEATSRDDKKLAEKFMPQAVKRCNACLLGQLRQFFFGSGAADS